MNVAYCTASPFIMSSIFVSRPGDFLLKMDGNKFPARQRYSENPYEVSKKTRRDRTFAVYLPAGGVGLGPSGIGHSRRPAGADLFHRRRFRVMEDRHPGRSKPPFASKKPLAGDGPERPVHPIPSADGPGPRLGDNRRRFKSHNTYLHRLPARDRPGRQPVLSVGTRT